MKKTLLLCVVSVCLNLQEEALGSERDPYLLRRQEMIETPPFVGGVRGGNLMTKCISSMLSDR